MNTIENVEISEQEDLFNAIAEVEINTGQIITVQICGGFHDSSLGCEMWIKNDREVEDGYFEEDFIKDIIDAAQQETWDQIHNNYDEYTAPTVEFINDCQYWLYCSKKPLPDCYSNFLIVRDDFSHNDFQPKYTIINEFEEIEEAIEYLVENAVHENVYFDYVKYFEEQELLKKYKITN